MVDAENVLSWKFSSSRKFNQHVVYIFELAWNSCLDLLYCILGVLACLQIYVLHVLACLNPLVPARLRARVFSMRACFMSLRDHISYMLAFLKYLSRLRAWYPRLTGVWQCSKCSSKGPFKEYLIKEGGGKFTKKVMKNDTGGRCAAKKFLQTIFFDDTIFAHLFLSNRF